MIPVFWGSRTVSLTWEESEQLVSYYIEASLNIPSTSEAYHLLQSCPPSVSFDFCDPSKQWQDALYALSITSLLFEFTSYDGQTGTKPFPPSVAQKIQSEWSKTLCPWITAFIEECLLQQPPKHRVFAWKFREQVCWTISALGIVEMLCEPSPGSVSFASQLLTDTPEFVRLYARFWLYLLETEHPAATTAGYFIRAVANASESSIEVEDRIALIADIPKSIKIMVRYVTGGAGAMPLTYAAFSTVIGILCSIVSARRDDFVRRTDDLLARKLIPRLCRFFKRLRPINDSSWSLKMRMILTDNYKVIAENLLLLFGSLFVRRGPPAVIAALKRDLLLSIAQASWVFHLPFLDPDDERNRLQLGYRSLAIVRLLGEIHSSFVYHGVFHMFIAAHKRVLSKCPESFIQFCITAQGQLESRRRSDSEFTVIYRLWTETHTVAHKLHESYQRFKEDPFNNGCANHQASEYMYLSNFKPVELLKSV
ncbi:hypothetical protein D9758_009597 [Tetrapyrgos nigripes]|uniref:Uncharacterized protein n=1 Tax=Tetrapyrgos nigripes TaxID=182062 RepID=A0A8H5GCT1_9AGAR|nr:hypothetical protein D9758_009597 [Tetrapyrgos nigripes]